MRGRGRLDWRCAGLCVRRSSTLADPLVAGWEISNLPQRSWQKPNRRRLCRPEDRGADPFQTHFVLYQGQAVRVLWRSDMSHITIVMGMTVNGHADAQRYDK